MRGFRLGAVSLALACSMVAAAKDKKKIILSYDVLDARTVFVMVDPGAGMAIDAPNANRAALEDVEDALAKWGRFRLVRSPYNADLVILVRKGNGRIAQPTIGGMPTDNRPVVVEPTTDASMSRPPMPGTTQPPRPDPHPQIEAGPTEDMFAVYRGNRENPTDSPAVWRLIRKDALRSPDVPAVDAFRKVMAEADKQRAANP